MILIPHSIDDDTYIHAMVLWFKMTLVESGVPGTTNEINEIIPYYQDLQHVNDQFPH